MCKLCTLTLGKALPSATRYSHRHQESYVFNLSQVAGTVTAKLSIENPATPRQQPNKS